MTAIEDNTIDRWGGRHGRYKGFPRRRLGLVDPVSSRKVAFTTALARDNWHLARFDADVVELNSTVEPLWVQIGARRFQAIADADLRRRTGKRELHLVCRTKPSDDKFRALCGVAKHLEAEVIVRTEAVIDPAAILLCNLRDLRQRMQLWSGRGSELDAQILELMAARQATVVADLTSAFVDIHPQLIDARLGHLHCRGDVTLQLSKETYGQHTPVLRSA